jgi:hypothetical protein
MPTLLAVMLAGAGRTGWLASAEVASNAAPATAANIFVATFFSLLMAAAKLAVT